MKPKLPPSKKINTFLDKLRLQTAKPNALIQLSILGLSVRLFTGSSIVTFIHLTDAFLSACYSMVTPKTLLRSFIIQFLSAFITLVSGHPIGREGPAIHLGSAIGSLPGQSLKLPNNTVRTLIACGAVGGAFRDI